MRDDSDAQLKVKVGYANRPAKGDLVLSGGTGIIPGSTGNFGEFNVFPPGQPGKII